MLQNDEDEDDEMELRGPGEPSTSGRENGAPPVSNGRPCVCRDCIQRSDITGTSCSCESHQ